MIKTTNLDKYFNKGKQNSIHVINDTTLEFPSRGLVSLVGQSGSGKTTLLNVISGLDKANGTIQFDDTVMTKYQSSKWDQIRSHDIGYVFQNYYLLEDKSVFDNIAITLNMIGIIDNEEVEYRTNYVLEAVGMFRFRKKRASDLSGGQKQRVAIARAIAKNPKVIIADEPTGNLDSTNSIEVMKIIKEISKERLVVLVTHNLDLANKYSDRIVTLSDGSVIKDESNEFSEDTKLNFDDNNIYLGNLHNHNNEDGLKLYSNSESNDIELTVVKINNTYYLKPTNDNIRINVIDNKSSIKLIDKRIEEVAEEKTFETNFSLDDLDKVKTTRVKKRTLSFKEALVSAFKKLSNLGKKSKVQIIALVLLGSMFSVSVHALFSNIIFDTSNVTMDKNAYYHEDGLEFDFDNPNGVMYSWSYSTDLRLLTNSNQDYGRYARFKDVLPLEAVKSTELTAGKYPTADNEVLIDESILKDKSDYSTAYNTVGIFKNSHFESQRIIYNDVELIITGTVNTGTQALYLNRVQLALSNNKLMTLQDFFTVLPTTKLIEGRLPLDTNPNGYIEVIMTNNFAYDIGDTFVEGGKTYLVVGFYEGLSNKILMTKQNFINLYTEEAESAPYYIDIYYSLDGKEPVDFTYNIRANQIKNLKSVNQTVMKTTAIQMAIAIAVSGLIFYFLVRSSMTKRVKEISILRSLGVSKYEVVSLFSLEYFILTLFTSFIGVLIGTYMINSLYNSFIGGMLGVRITPLSIIVSILGIFITNILLALIPVLLLLRKTPASMLTNYDI